MTIKIRKEKTGINRYKSSKSILTPGDIKKADDFDIRLNEKIKDIESILEAKNIISDKGKKDPLMVWYLVGKNINKFLKDNYLEKDDEDLFWNYLYSRSSVINKTTPTKRISQTRNDFRLASKLARYKFSEIKEVGSWAIWREMLAYKIFMYDERILKWIIKELIKFPKTRKGARLILKSIASRFKGIDTLVFSDIEIIKKIKEVRY